MANVRGGDILQLTADGRELDVAADANVTYREGGFINENTPTGNGGLHTKRTRKLGGFDSLPLSNDNSKGDLKYLQGKSNDGATVNWQMTLAGGEIWSGDLVPEGDIDANTGDGQVEISALGITFEQI